MSILPHLNHQFIYLVPTTTTATNIQHSTTLMANHLHHQQPMAMDMLMIPHSSLQISLSCRRLITRLVISLVPQPQAQVQTLPPPHPSLHPKLLHISPSHVTILMRPPFVVLVLFLYTHQCIPILILASNLMSCQH